MTVNRREIACAIMIGQDDNFLLQLRDDKPGLLFSGMIGLFGGHREGMESFLDCARREVLEETGFAPEKSAFEPLVEYKTRYPDGAEVEGHYFVLRNVPEDKLVITEGTLVSVLPYELPNYLPRMTPATCFVIKTFIDLPDNSDLTVGNLHFGDIGSLSLPA